MLEPKFEPVEGFLRINMGPQHPATHGVINFVVETDGEIMRQAVPDVGYLHRGIEKLAELTTYPGFVPYTDRVDYLAAMFCNQGYVMAVEKLMGLEIPKRAEYLRVIACELNRIASHLVATGTMAMDLGAFTPFTHWIRERETINDLMEIICGARLTYNYMRVGGVSKDWTPDLPQRVRLFLDHFVPIIDEFDRLITNNEIFVQRLANVGVISPETAAAWSLSGPNLRASGVDWDLRRDEPYSAYPDFKFEVPLGKGFRGTVGDSYDRFVVRVLEMRESAKIVRQALDGLPAGEFRGKVPRVLKPPKGEVYSRVESARGEMGYYLVSEGGDKPARVKIRTGSFTACAAVEVVSPGLMIADLVALIGSLDVVAPEIDR
jgi:NADH-quinone oxidoreductase subunit D